MVTESAPDFCFLCFFDLSLLINAGDKCFPSIIYNGMMGFSALSEPMESDGLFINAESIRDYCYRPIRLRASWANWVEPEPKA